MSFNLDRNNYFLDYVPFKFHVYFNVLLAVFALNLAISEFLKKCPVWESEIAFLYRSCNNSTFSITTMTQYNKTK